MADEEHKKPSGGNRQMSARNRKRRIEPRILSGAPPDDLPQDVLSSEDGESEPVAEPPPPSVQEQRPVIPPAEQQPRRRSPAERFPPIPTEKSDASTTRSRPARTAPAPGRARFGCRDLVALVFVLGTIAAGGYFLYIWNNPYSPLNPLSPPVPPPVIISQTPLPTATATATLTRTPRPTATFTPLVAGFEALTSTVDPQATPDLTLTLLAGTPSATPPPPPFALIRSGIVRMSNVNTQGCDFLGIAGSVVDFDGKPLNGYIIWITGEDIDNRLVSGSDNTYGAGGFLLPVGSEPEIRPFAAMLLAPDGVTPLSEPYTFLTSDICEFNITVLRFIQVGDF